MSNEQKEMIYCFIEEMDLKNSDENSFHKQTVSLIERFEEIGGKYEDLNDTMDELSDFLINMCDSIKMKYFEYGILAALSGKNFVIG